MNIYIELYYKPFISKALRYGPCVTKGITQIYSPASKRYCPLAGTDCAYPRRDGQAELTWVDVTYRNKCLVFVFW